jgi:hypothetical protein
LRKVLVLALLGLAGAALAVGVAQAGQGKASVRVTQVLPNANTGCVTLRLDLRGWKMYPGRIGKTTNDGDGGHYHVYVNGKYHNFGSNAYRARACGLATSKTYQLQVILAYNDHTELAARSQVVSAILG